MVFLSADWWEPRIEDSADRIRRKQTTKGMEEISMVNDDVRSIFLKTGALFTGHFVITSALHSDTYLEKFAVLQYHDMTQRLCDMIAAASPMIMYKS